MRGVFSSQEKLLCYYWASSLIKRMFRNQKNIKLSFYVSLDQELHYFQMKLYFLKAKTIFRAWVLTPVSTVPSLPIPPLHYRVRRKRQIQSSFVWLVFCRILNLEHLVMWRSYLSHRALSTGFRIRGSHQSKVRKFELSTIINHYNILKHNECI